MLGNNLKSKVNHLKTVFLIFESNWSKSDGFFVLTMLTI